MRIRGARDDRNPAFGIARQPQRSGCPGDAAANDQNLCLAQSVYFPELVIAAELLTNSQHSLNRMQRSPTNLFVDLDLVLNVNIREASVSSNVIWFMWGQRTLHKRSISFSGLAAEMLSPIEHSVSNR